MGAFLDFLFFLFQGVASDASNRQKKVTANKYVAMLLITVLLLIVILIWLYNPAPQSGSVSGS